MVRMEPIKVAAVVLVVLTAWWINRPDTNTASVSRVIDGDTIVLSDGQKVRLLQINAPEKGQCGYVSATRELTKLVSGGEVTLESEPRFGDKDKYGRLLRYVFVDNLNVNVYLQQHNFVDTMFYNDDHGKYAYLFTGIGPCA